MPKPQLISEEQARALLPLSEATYLILLALLQPNHGYGIMLDVQAKSGVRVGPGTLYGALTNLLKQGLIRREGDNDGADDRRKLYALTSFGRMVVELECIRMESLSRIGRESLKSVKGDR
jgi:Predicted transcriptional regulators